MSVLEVNNFSELYSDSTSTARIALLEKEFARVFNTEHEFIVRSPGRVNLIGEHIDYSGYGVLPMAIELDVVILLRRNTDKSIHLVNALPHKFPARTFEGLDAKIPIDSKVHEWSNYFLAGVKGVLEHLAARSSPPDVVGFSALVSGTVPTGAGLSSSSALVCASALATMVAQGVSIPKQELATLCASCERYVGTEGGGMDQAISLLAEKGAAKLIEFNPLRAKDVLLPSGASFVIANSLVESHKQLMGSKQFNMRVVECRLAAVLLSRLLNLGTEIRKLGEVQQKSGLSLQEMVDTAKKLLHQEPYTLAELSKVFNKDEAAITQDYLGAVRSDSFELYKRALHVFSEANRVYLFNETAQKAPYKEQLNDLGLLMNQSQESCSSLYNCSCEELDTLTSICRKSGALGSRLTGAGWGGCTVSLVPTAILDTFLKQVREEYYSQVVKLSNEKLYDKDILFATQPGSGAAILRKLA